VIIKTSAFAYRHNAWLKRFRDFDLIKVQDKHLGPKKVYKQFTYDELHDPKNKDYMQLLLD
jgi:hypothetical protein